jgi:hemerythrin superfamily protein
MPNKLPPLIHYCYLGALLVALRLHGAMAMTLRAVRPVQYDPMEVNVEIGTDNGLDVVQLLIQDHEAVKALFERLDREGEDVAVVFGEIVKNITMHEIAEEQVVYPAVRRWVEGGSEIADARLSEERAGRELLAAMERMEVGSQEFRDSLQALKAATLDHAANEEAEVFPALEASAAPQKLRSLAFAYAMAKAVAPTHPHPGVPNTLPGHLLVGPAFALVDRGYDFIRSTLQKASA